MPTRYSAPGVSRVEYIAKLAYEPWMVDSRLVLRERMTGCLDCTAATEESTVKAPFIKLFTPRYVTPFVTPEREAVKVRNEVRVARLQFRQESRMWTRATRTTARSWKR